MGFLNKDSKKMLGIAGRYSAIGLEMVIAIAVGLFFGNWLDGRFGTGPWLTILFGLFGTAAAFKGILRHIKGIDIDRL